MITMVRLTTRLRCSLDHCLAFFCFWLSTCVAPPQSLASLSDFYEDSWISVRISVWWRCCTIVTGVAISGTVCMLVLPVFAGDVARAALADALRASAALLGGVVELYLTVRPTPLSFHYGHPRTR